MSDDDLSVSDSMPGQDPSAHGLLKARVYTIDPEAPSGLKLIGTTQVPALSPPRSRPEPWVQDLRPTLPVVTRLARPRERRYRRRSSSGGKSSRASPDDPDEPAPGAAGTGLTELPTVCPRCGSAASVRRGVRGLAPTSWSCRWCLGQIILRAEPARGAE
jgi:hypothetical protein